VASPRVLLQVIHHRPAVHTGQQDIENDGIRFELACQFQSQVAAHGHQALEASLACNIQQDLSKNRIIFHDQDHTIIRLNPVPVVGEVQSFWRSFYGWRLRTNCNSSRNFARNSDRKSTRLNSSHVAISYADFCLKKKNMSPY